MENFISTGMGLIQPGNAVTQCSASIKTRGRLERLDASNISTVSVVSAVIADEGQLHNVSEVGLLVVVKWRGSVLFNLISIKSQAGVSAVDGLNGLTAFLLQSDALRLPWLISIQADCTVKIQIDADLTLVFQPIPACITAIEG
jgi:hypothetical protein